MSDITEPGVTEAGLADAGVSEAGLTEAGVVEAALVDAAVAQWFDGRSRVLFVHAHPDDETITTGGTLAALAETGREPLLVTLTRGERGEVVSGPLEALVHAHGLAVVRQNELKNALAMLGLQRHAFLGVDPARAEGLDPVIYEDSGMVWESADAGTTLHSPRATVAPDAGPDALTRTPAVEQLNDLMAAAYRSGAQAVVSYDDGGGYGHPDHVRAHQLARAVAQALSLPFWEIVSTLGDPAGDDHADLHGGAASDIEHHSVEHYSVEAWLERKVAALRCHTTQLIVDGDDLVHVGGQRHSIGRVESFRRLRSPAEIEAQAAASRA